MPLVSTRFHAVAGLDVLLLWSGAPGEILRGGGDIDNRLKTLFDALKVPDANALPVGASSAADQDPFYCFLEDDKLVTRVQVETDHLLGPRNEKEVVLVLRVSTAYMEAKWANVGL